MVSFLADLGTSFILGLLTPLTALCVIPLYPGFIAYLSSQTQNLTDTKLPLKFGLVVVSGVISFMLLLGLIFTTIFEISLTNVVGIISPIAFGILAIISLMLIFNIDFSKYFPKMQTPVSQNPLKSAFLFGFFFGAIVIPCNPAFIAALFAKTFVMSNFIGNILNFLSFGIGIGTPLLILAAISSEKSRTVINFITLHKRKINLITGLILLPISLYYLIYVFKILG